MRWCTLNSKGYFSLDQSKMNRLPNSWSAWHLFLCKRDRCRHGCRISPNCRNSSRLWSFLTVIRAAVVSKPPFGSSARFLGSLPWNHTNGIHVYNACIRSRVSVCNDMIKFKTVIRIIGISDLGPCSINTVISFPSSSFWCLIYKYLNEIFEYPSFIYVIRSQCTIEKITYHKSTELYDVLRYLCIVRILHDLHFSSEFFRVHLSKIEQKSE